MKLQKYAKYLGVITLAVGLAAGCASTDSKSGMDSMADKEVKQTIADAKSALKTAEKGGYAWRDTGKFIKQAEKALADGDAAKAASLAKKALQQTELAKKQDEEQDRAIKARFN